MASYRMHCMSGHNWTTLELFLLTFRQPSSRRWSPSGGFSTYGRGSFLGRDHPHVQSIHLNGEAEEFTRFRVKQKKRTPLRQLDDG